MTESKEWYDRVCKHLTNHPAFGNRGNDFVELCDGLLNAVKALQYLGTHPEYNYCYCSSQEQIENGHTGECKEAREALFALPDWLLELAM